MKKDAVSGGLNKLIPAGVSKLRRFGFTNVTEDNILVDEVYLFFLLRFAETLKGKNKELDIEIEYFNRTFENYAK